MHKLLDMHSGTREELITAIQRHWALQVGPAGHSSVGILLAAQISRKPEQVSAYRAL